MEGGQGGFGSSKMMNGNRLKEDEMSPVALRKGAQTFLTCPLSLAQRGNIKRGFSNNDDFPFAVGTIRSLATICHK